VASARRASEALDRVCRGAGNDFDVVVVADRVRTVADEARCFLAQQHQRVLASIEQYFPHALEHHLAPDATPIERIRIAAIRDYGPDGTFTLEDDQLAKQPDWSFDAEPSGKTPVERLADSEP
jgi:hypothetical protein